MSAATSDRRLELPLWVAGFDFDERSAARPSPDGQTRIGAFHVLRADAGAEFCMFGAPGRPSTVLFDGFLFDRDELCEQLRLSRGVSHAQIVASAYQTWGADCLSRLAGCYLVAIADAGTGRLLLGHDPLGRHPVFYSSGARAIWFGSNVLTLAASGEVSNRPNRLSLALAAMTLWPAAGETFFADIKRLRPGHYLLVAHDGTTREQRYWDPLPQSESEWLSEREVLDAFEPALHRAVARCMQFTPDGIMLSGGVDSVTVAALATAHRREHAQSPLVAVSGRTDEPILQEDHMQARAADALGMPHFVVHKSQWTHSRNDIELSLEAMPDLPGPSRIYWAGSYMGFYRMAAQNNLRVLLTGSGGDNWLSVADTHAADLIRRFRLRQLGHFVGAAVRTGGSSYKSATKHLLWHGGIRPLVDSFATMLVPGPKARFHRKRAEMTVPSWLCPDPPLRRSLVDYVAHRRTPGLDRAGRFPRNYYQHSLASVDNAHVYYEFETAFHVETMCGLRLLSPYHDADLVRFFTRIPPPVLVYGNKYKGLLRPVVERHLPGLGFGGQRKDYPKRAVDLDLQNLREGVTRTWPTFPFSKLSAMDLVNPSLLQQEVTPSSSTDFYGLLRMYALMGTEIWTSVHNM